jgi:hypothetical protein
VEFLECLGVDFKDFRNEDTGVTLVVPEIGVINRKRGCEAETQFPKTKTKGVDGERDEVIKGQGLEENGSEVEFSEYSRPFALGHEEVDEVETCPGTPTR